MSAAISYPFTLDSFGKVTSTDQYTKIYLDKVLTLLSTNLRQRPMLQDYGADLGKYLFESDNNLEAAVDNTIRAAVKTWLPDLAVKKVSVSLPNEDGTSNVEVIIRMPNGNMAAVTLTTATFGYDGTVTR